MKEEGHMLFLLVDQTPSGPGEIGSLMSMLFYYFHLILLFGSNNVVI